MGLHLMYISSTDWGEKHSYPVYPVTEQNSTEATAPEESVPTQGLVPRMVETIEKTDSFTSRMKGAAVQPVKGVQQQVRSGPKKKKDLGTLGKCWVD